MKAVKKLTNQLRRLINFSVGSINFVKTAETESRVQCIPRLNKDSSSLKSISLHFALVTCLHVAQSHSFLFLGFIMHFSTPIKSQQSIIYIILQYFPIFMYNKIQWTIFLVSRKLLSSLLENLPHQLNTGNYPGTHLIIWSHIKLQGLTNMSPWQHIRRPPPIKLHLLLKPPKSIIFTGF